MKKSHLDAKSIKLIDAKSTRSNAPKKSSHHNLKMINKDQSSSSSSPYHNTQTNDFQQRPHSPTTLLNVFAKSKQSKSKRQFNDPYEIPPSTCRDYVWLAIYYVGLYTFFATFWFVCWSIYLTTLPEGRPRYPHNNIIPRGFTTLPPKEFILNTSGISELARQDNYSVRSGHFVYDGVGRTFNLSCNNST